MSRGHADHVTAVIAKEPTALTERVQSEKHAAAKGPDGEESSDDSAIPDWPSVPSGDPDKQWHCPKQYVEQQIIHTHMFPQVIEGADCRSVSGQTSGENLHFGFLVVSIQRTIKTGRVALASTLRPMFPIW